jgi:hypothetical protein
MKTPNEEIFHKGEPAVKPQAKYLAPRFTWGICTNKFVIKHRMR